MFRLTKWAVIMGMLFYIVLVLAIAYVSVVAIRAFAGRRSDLAPAPTS